MCVCVVLLGCGGGPKSTLTDAEKQLFESFVNADVAALDEAGFADLIKKQEELIAKGAAMKMSGSETDRTTAQIEAMIQRLETEVQSATSAKQKQEKGRQLHNLKKSIGRGGA